MRTKIKLVIVAVLLFFNFTAFSQQTLSATAAGSVVSSAVGGSSSVIIGFEAGYNLPNGNGYDVYGTESERNTFLGFRSGKATVTGQNNLFSGFSSGLINTVGSYNTFLGSDAGVSNLGGMSNVFCGYQAGNSNSSGYNNTYVGTQSGKSGNGTDNVATGYLSGLNAQGKQNCFYGSGTNQNNVLNSTTMDDNSFFGYTAGFNNSGTENLFLGSKSGNYNTGGSRNLFVGRSSGERNLTGNGNVFLGYQSGQFETSSNKLYIDNTGTTTPLIYGDFTTENLTFNVDQSSSSSVIINSGVSNSALNGTSGLRFSNLNNTTNATTNTTNSVLSVNASGDVILVTDQTGSGSGTGLTSSCSTTNFLPIYTATTNTFGCSQIFDNGTSVGINTTGTFGYSSLSGFQLGSTVPSSTGDFRLDVNGVTRSVAYFASSDSKFKKNVKPIKNALSQIQLLEGKTYNWKKEEFKEMDFNDQVQIGLIAQEVEKVFPSLVAKSIKGDYSINYIGLIPVLIEALKEQQTQIDELKAQVNDNFKTQNNDLLKLENTKIISVSPNPSNDVIAVSLNIEKSVQSAKLLVHDINGTVLSSLNINERDTNITKTLQKDNFGKGIYIVSLVVNGKSIDTKKIVFN